MIPSKKENNGAVQGGLGRRPMKIWIISHYDTTPKYPGSTRHFDFAKELVKRGHSVTIFAASIHYLLLRETIDYEGKDSVTEIIDGIRFVWIRTYPYQKNNWKRFANMLSFSKNAFRIAKKINLEKPDILFGSSVHLFAVHTAYRLAKRFRLPLVMEVRDLWPKTLIDFGFPRWHPLVIVLGFLEKFLYRRAKKIISLLPHAGKYIQSLGIAEEKIVYIPNGVDISPFAASGSIPAKPAGQENSFRVTYTGAIGVPNNMDVFIDAAEILRDQHPHIKFLLVGDGKEKARLIDTAVQRNLSNVEFLDPVPKSDLALLLRQSDVLFVALKGINLYDFGISLNKLFDYLAAAKPVITSMNTANNPIRDAAAGICVPADRPAEIADAILTLYNMPAEDREAVGKRGFDFVEKNYSIPVLTDKLEGLLMELSR
jgi:glycosyltransferase involved in cell wall biosynthesis